MSLWLSPLQCLLSRTRVALKECDNLPENRQKLNQKAEHPLKAPPRYYDEDTMLKKNLEWIESFMDAEYPPT